MGAAPVRTVPRHADLGRLIRERRERRGLTQAELAQAVGVHFATMSRIEADTRRPGWHVCERLADALDLWADDLHDLAGHDPPPDPEPEAAPPPPPRPSVPPDCPEAREVAAAREHAEHVRRLVGQRRVGASALTTAQHRLQKALAQLDQLRAEHGPIATDPAVASRPSTT